MNLSSLKTKWQRSTLQNQDTKPCFHQTSQKNLNNGGRYYGNQISIESLNIYVVGNYEQIHYMGITLKIKQEWAKQKYSMSNRERKKKCHLLIYCIYIKEIWAEMDYVVGIKDNQQRDTLVGHRKKWIQCKFQTLTMNYTHLDSYGNF